VPPLPVVKDPEDEELIIRAESWEPLRLRLAESQREAGE